MVELIVDESPDDDVNKGLVRINIHNRNGLERKDLVEIGIEGNLHKIIRRLYGTEKKGYILLDLESRKNDKKWNLNKNEKQIFTLFKIKKYMIRKIFSYYWKHPDVPTRVTFKVGMIGISLAVFAIMLSIIFRVI